MQRKIVNKAEYLPPILFERYEALDGDALDNLEDSINIQKALETRLLEQLTTGESSDAWRIINELCDAYTQADPTQQVGIFNRIRHVANGGLQAYGIRKEIQQAHEWQRKLAETLTKCRKDVSETYSQGQWESMMAVLLSIVNETCDHETRLRIAKAIKTHQQLPQRPQKVIELTAQTENTNGTMDISTRGNGFSDAESVPVTTE